MNRRDDHLDRVRRGGGRSRNVASVAVCAIALLATACSDTSLMEPFPAEPDSLSSGSTTQDLTTIAPLVNDPGPADFDVRESVEQVSVTGSEPGTQLVLHDDSGRAVATSTTDDQGSLIFRQVRPGEGYRVATVPSGDADQEASETLDIVSIENSMPEQTFYDDAELEPGFTYIETRDGTMLSASVYLPGPIEDGPYPTVVEYSGYSPSKPPTNLIEDRFEDLSDLLPGVSEDDICELAPFACEAPDQPGSLIANALGYAVVAVNMRGTGCSGGAYDFFEPLQILDGYDIIETVAAQDWVKNNRVGMVGLSYPAIAQLFVASAAPPSLAAITPLSVYDDTARGVLAPGGIFNEGFALQWASEVLENAEPYGQGWEQDVVDGGDELCAENQLLRGQNVDAVAKAQSFPYYEPEVADPLNLSLLVEDVDVPVFLTGAFQDEQTGGRFPLLFDDFDNAPVTRFSGWNGAHADGFAPQNLVEWKTFLDFYVAEELTEREPLFDLFVPLIMDQVFGASLALPPQRMFEDEGDFEAQRAAYEAEQPIRLLLENGAGDPDKPGAPVASTELRFDEWPPAGTTPIAWYLGADGTLSQDEPSGDGAASRFNVDDELASQSSFADTDGNDPFRADAEYDWKQEPAGSATVFVSDPLDQDEVLIGSASADLWIRSSAPEADLGVTLSEVRPDGSEVYIQSGTLRGSMRAVAEGSTDLLPLHTGFEADAEPFPNDEFVEARIEIFPFAHIIREDSRIRLSVHTPGGDKVRWKYILAPHPDDAVVDVGHSAELPSRLVLPSVPGISSYPDAPPACGALRAQPCRDFEDYENTLAE